jgi:hypothetical protein
VRRGLVASALDDELNGEVGSDAVDAVAVAAEEAPPPAAAVVEEEEVLVVEMPA